MAKGFCMGPGCRQMREIANPQQVKMKNGRPATTGPCVICGTKIYVIGKAKP